MIQASLFFWPTELSMQDFFLPPHLPGSALSLRKNEALSRKFEHQVNIANCTVVTVVWGEASCATVAFSSLGRAAVAEPGLFLCGVGGLLGATVFLADTFPTAPLVLTIFLSPTLLIAVRQARYGQIPMDLR